MKVAQPVLKKVSELQEWKFNQDIRSISREKYAKLENDIKAHGFNDVLKLAADGITVLGGNHSLKILSKNGVAEVSCIITDAKTDQEKFDTAIRANAHYATYERQGLAELAVNLGFTPIELQSYEVNLGKPTDLDSLVKQFSPDDKDEDDKDDGEELEPLFCVVANCVDIEQQETLSSELNSRGYITRLASTKIDKASLANLFKE